MVFSFTKDSVVVKAWVNAVKAGTMSIDDVPALFNLKEVVKAVLEGGEN